MAKSTEVSDPSANRRRGPYAKTVAVRARILQACLEVFGESGYGASTFAEIAVRSGLSQRGLLHHFGSKRELLMAVIQAHERLPRSVPPSGSPDVIGAVLSVALETAELKRGIVELHTMISAEAISSDHPAHDYYLLRYDGIREYLAGSFTALREAGRLRSDVPSETLASMLVALLDGLQLQWLYSPESVDLRETVLAFLRSIGATEVDIPGSADTSPGEVDVAHTIPEWLDTRH
ncbi:TetR/AcrR family transcriptional regulator [Arthrobacter sp. TMT4-20]